MMTKVTRIVLLALLLQVTTAGNFIALAQTRQEELKQFDDFVALQMKLDKTPGLTIGFIKDNRQMGQRS